MSHQDRLESRRKVLSCYFRAETIKYINISEVELTKAIVKRKLDSSRLCIVLSRAQLIWEHIVDTALCKNFIALKYTSTTSVRRVKQSHCIEFRTYGRWPTGVWLTAFRQAIGELERFFDYLFQDQSFNEPEIDEIQNSIFLLVLVLAILVLLKFAAFLVSGVGSESSLAFISAFGGRLAAARKHVSKEHSQNGHLTGEPREPEAGNDIRSFLGVAYPVSSNPFEVLSRDSARIRDCDFSLVT